MPPVIATPGAWVIGPVTLALDEEPDDGIVPFGSKGVWAYFNPVGFTGRVRQFLGYDALDPELHLTCGETTMRALKALTGPTRYDVSFPRPLWETGRQVTVEEVDAKWTKNVPGGFTQANIDADAGDHPEGASFGLYDVTVKMVELQAV